MRYWAFFRSQTTDTWVIPTTGLPSWVGGYHRQLAFTYCAAASSRRAEPLDFTTATSVTRPSVRFDEAFKDRALGLLKVAQRRFLSGVAEDV